MINKIKAYYKALFFIFLIRSIFARTYTYIYIYRRIKTHILQTIWKGNRGLINPGFLLSMRLKQPSPILSPRPLESLVGAVGTHPISLIIPIMLWADIPIKGEQPSGHKTLKAAIRQVAPRFTSSRGSRQIKAVGREPTAVLSGRLTYSFRFVTWHAGMRDNYSKDAGPLCRVRARAR